MPKNLVLSFPLILFAAVLFAGPPYATDDPEPVQYRHWEVYIFSALSRYDSGWSGTLPGFEVNYGVLPETQAHVILPLNFAPDNQGKTGYGYGSTEIGVKYRFVRETDIMPQIGIFPLYEIPGGGVPGGQPELYLPVWAQKTWGQFTSYGGGGYWIDINNGGRDRLFLGLVLQYAFLQNVSAGLEINGTTQAGSGANIGVVIDLDDMNHVLASAGRSITGGGIYQGYIAYQLTFGPEEKKQISQ